MSKTHLQQIGNNIKTARKLKGMTQEQLAGAAGLRTATISDIEAGKQNFEINTLVRIANALGFCVDITFTPA
jgi:transcriptional regulator with XRE-family HTH domain